MKWVLGSIAIFLVFFLLGAIWPVRAQDSWTPHKSIVGSGSCEYWGGCYRRRYQSWEQRNAWQRYYRRDYRAVVRHDYREAELRYYAAPRLDRSDRGERCKDVRRAVGDQHLTVEGAKKASNDAWAAAVRFHHGEVYLSLENAREITYTCSRSSIKEGGVTTLGQTLTRCELEAIPCRAPRLRGDEER